MSSAHLYRCLAAREDGTRKTLFLDLKIIFKTVPAIISQTKDIKDTSNSDKKPASPDASVEQHQC